MKDLISIITPAYNASDFLEECVATVISQTYENWEMIIVDDCSKDNTRDILSNLSKEEERIIPIYLEKNVGAAQARNIAISNAKGRYIAFLDADDFWMSEKLEKQIVFMQKNNIAFCFTTYQFISENGEKKKNLIKAPKSISYHSYLKNTIIGCLTVVLDREIIGDVTMPNIRSSHDMALWLRIMRRGFIAYGLDENLAKYRVVSSSNTANKIKAAKDVWNVYRKEEGLNLLYSMICFCGYVFNAINKRL